MNDKTYKREFTFGKVDANGIGRKCNLVTLDVELKIEDKGPVFSASGNVWNNLHTDIIMGGQCLGDIWRDYKHQLTNRKQYAQILRLWDCYHLNDMNPGCKHQRAQKWGDKELRLATIKLDSDTLQQQREIEREIESEVKTMGRVQITPEAQAIYKLPYSLTIPAEQVEQYPRYRVDSTETKRAGWVNESEHPEGVLGKPCPVCGYKYGTSWVYEPIPAEDLQEILQLLEVDYQEQAAIMRAVGGEAHE